MTRSVAVTGVGSGLTAQAQPRVWVEDAARLASSFEHCAEVARTQGRNFYYGMRLTPRGKRDAMYALYAWMRAVDDLADDLGDEGPSASERELKLRRLEAFRHHTLHIVDPQGGLPEQPLTDAPGSVDHARLWPAARQSFLGFGIGWGMLEPMIEGQLLDQRRTRYDTFEELYDYCYKVASVVGFACVQVWGYDASQGERVGLLAEKRGVALQLTNVLRDVVEDAGRGRLYLPAEDVRAAGLEPESLLVALREGRGLPGFDRLMRGLIARATDCYRASAGLESLLNPACRATSWAMMRIYRDLLARIEADPMRVLRSRVSLGKAHKLSIAGIAWARGLVRA